jgi:predicted nucleic acid-binding protein
VPFLLDTNVVSELRRASPDGHVLAWHRRESGAEVFLSTLVVGEIRQGIERVRPRNPHQADALEHWLAGLVAAYRERLLPVTAEVAQMWGRLNASTRRPPVVDGLMAATAIVHRLTLVTRNVRHVTGTGVDVINPFQPTR